MELLEAVEACLCAAERLGDQLTAALSGRTAGELAAVARLRWVERQLANLASKLSAARLDLVAGLTAHDMGYADDQEMQELIEDMAVQIGQLLALLQALNIARAIGR